MSENMQAIHDELDFYKTFFLCTVDGDTPDARPVGMNMMVDGKLYFGVGTFKAVWAQLQANPRFTVVACKGGRWFRMRATAVFDDNERVAEMALDAAPHLRSIYNEETGYKLGTFTFKDAHAEWIPKMMGAARVLDF